jgi:hypothetical protein
VEGHIIAQQTIFMESVFCLWRGFMEKHIEGIWEKSSTRLVIFFFFFFGSTGV